MNNPEQTARLIFELALKTVADGIEKKPFSGREMIGFYLVHFFARFDREQAYAFYFGGSGKLAGRLHLQDGGSVLVDPVAESIEKRGDELFASSFIIAHSHPGLPAAPSAEDVLSTERIKRFFEGSHILFLEHFIVSGNDYSTMFTETLWKKRYDGGRITVF